MIRQRTDTGKWEVRWRENGHHRSKSFTHERDARRFARKVDEARERGDLLDMSRGKETVSEFVERWWRDYAVSQLSDNTRAHYGRLWEKHLRKPIGGYSLRSVTPAVVDGLRAELVAGGVGAPTVRKALVFLSGVMSAAVRWDRIERNPVREVRKPSAKRTRHVRPFPPRVVETIRASFLADEQVRDAVLVCLLAYAGLRPEEARALRWSDFVGGAIYVERAAAGSTIKTTKTGEPRTVTLLRPLADDVRAWRAASEDREGLVFPTSRGTLWTDYDWRNWRKRVFKPAAEAAGFPQAVPYDLRHSFASLLIREGLTVVEVAAQLGNAPEVTLSTYAHVFREFTPGEPISAEGAILAARAEFDVRGVYAESGTDEDGEATGAASTLRADARIRTADPFITSEVLYQLSYVGV